MKRDDFCPTPDDETFAGWHERVCPDEHALLKTVSVGGREGDIYRAAVAEGRMAMLYGALTNWPDVSDAHALIRMLIAGEYALANRRASVGAVRKLLKDFES